MGEGIELSQTPLKQSEDVLKATRRRKMTQRNNSVALSRFILLVTSLRKSASVSHLIRGSRTGL